MVQKYMKALLVHKRLVNQILKDPSLKLKETIIGLELTAAKVPSKKDDIFVKGLQKF